MIYQIHSSTELTKLFKEKPYQGQNPEKAKVLIVGNDANYSSEISNDKFFERILEYHLDGISFWKNHEIHHPFLLSEYPFDKRKDGVRYHMNFNKMQFNSKHAEYFSFVELLNVPTTGNTGSNKNLFFEMLNENHLKWLEKVIFHGEKKFVLINQTLVRSIKQISKKFGIFRELFEAIERKTDTPYILETDNVVL